MSRSHHQFAHFIRNILKCVTLLEINSSFAVIFELGFLTTYIKHKINTDWFYNSFGTQCKQWLQRLCELLYCRSLMHLLILNCFLQIPFWEFFIYIMNLQVGSILQVMEQVYRACFKAFEEGKMKDGTFLKILKRSVKTL